MFDAAAYRADIDDPEHCNALSASLVCELALLKVYFLFSAMCDTCYSFSFRARHRICAAVMCYLILMQSSYHPHVVKYANDTLLEKSSGMASPLDLWKIYDASGGGFNPPIKLPKKLGGLKPKAKTAQVTSVHKAKPSR